MADYDDDLNPHEWEKPAWAKDGPKLKSTGKVRSIEVLDIFGICIVSDCIFLFSRDRLTL